MSEDMNDDDQETLPPSSHESEAMEIFEAAIRAVGEERARLAILAVKLGVEP